MGREAILSEMSDPVRLTVETLTELPSVDELSRKADGSHHVVLHLARTAAFDKSALIVRLAQALPDHSVFNSGADTASQWVTVKRVISRATIQSHAAALLAAVHDYLQTCKMLIAAEQSNRLSSEWTANAHGEHVRFKNTATGQVVETPCEQLEQFEPDP